MTFELYEPYDKSIMIVCHNNKKYPYNMPVNGVHARVASATMQSPQDEMQERVLGTA